MNPIFRACNAVPSERAAPIPDDVHEWILQFVQQGNCSSAAYEHYTALCQAHQALRKNSGFLLNVRMVLK